ncbi:hypothetical protein J6590_056092 [Homalodisca vitripennis]|nr:hypothetical protein J6590_056092 [Homalodisca vitripennis]
MVVVIPDLTRLITLWRLLRAKKKPLTDLFCTIAGPGSVQGTPIRLGHVITGDIVSAYGKRLPDSKSPNPPTLRSPTQFINYYI